MQDDDGQDAPPRGGVYMIGTGRGTVKIGIALNPTVRLTELQTGNPHRLGLWGFWPHHRPIGVEKEAHRLLASCRLVGEWFAVTRHDAVTAIEQAIENIDKGGHLFAQVVVIDPIPEPEPLDERDIEAAITGGSVEPPAVPKHLQGTSASPLTAAQHKLGYARRIPSATVAQQADWMIRSGVNQADIYMEDAANEDCEWKASMKDFREGDAFYLWSAEVIPPPDTLEETERRAAAKGGFLIFWNGEFVHAE